LPGTAARRLPMYKVPCFTESAINVPKAAPRPAGAGPNMTAKKAGTTTAGLN